MIEDLLKLGFTQHEADIYLALLDAGQTGAGELIRRTGLHRNIVYETLDKLIAKKLVIKAIKKNIAQFIITDPQRILENQKAKLSLAESVIPELKGRAKTQSNIVIWDGLEGFRNFSLSHIERIEKGSLILCIGSTGDRWYELIGDAAKRYMRIKAKRKIRWKMISYEGPSTSQMDLKNVLENKVDEVRFLPKHEKAPANIVIWGDSIAMQIYAEPISVVEIQNKALAEAYSAYFYTMWEMGKSIA